MDHEDWATPNERVCEGVKPSDGLKCSRRATDPNYPFCMTQHDKRANYCDPQMFRQDGLRNQMLETLRKRDKNHDRYNPGRKTSTRASSDEVDHIGECQTAAMCCQFATFTNDEEKHDVVKFFSGNLVNESRNFLVTSAVTNQRKGQGTTHFQQDLMKFSLSQYGEPNSQALDDIREASFNVPIVATYNDRLLEQGLSRASTRAIRRESGQALQYWKYKCLDEGDSPIYDVLGKLVGKIFVVFDLHIDADLD
ncbi:hypothetical protein P3T76_014164 [Phytophthora citrophthora]|uniref:Uncharacterized protein n=1 Tax=Phytophthora citrophthora TaxID=4793 RepID=A0AAD9G2T5_9STRA|nr:hypothetical protein P3T76_014164 [Phytophthora citrophthora]